MKKLMLTMLSVVGMMLFVALPAKACTSYYVGKDCTKDGTTMYGRTEDYSPKKDKVYKVIQPKKVVCIPSSRQLKKYKIFVLPGVYRATFLCRQSLLFMKFHWC